MHLINIERLLSAPVVPNPFDHIVVNHFIGPETIDRVNATFPAIRSGGSYTVDHLTDAMAIKQVIADLDSRQFEEAIEQKFAVNLSGHPKLYSLRGHTRARDGAIHTDSIDKLITVLLYLNPPWPHAVGRLRLLRSGSSLDDYAVEIPPDNGTLLVFRRSDRSWHGHEAYVGVRRALQMNWMTNEKRRGWHAFRHGVSAAIKKVVPA